MNNDIESLDRLQELLHIPPLPGTALRLIELVNDPEVDLSELARTIEQDPPLAARIVGVANSAWFARGREVVNVEDAIIRVLGLELVRGLALGMALGKPFDVRACEAFDVQRYWYLAFVTGSMARDLAPHAKLQEDSIRCAFLAGLLHNFGQIVLAHAFPRHYAGVLLKAEETDPESRLRLERDTLAIDEIQAGRFVGRRWHLPDCVIDTLQSFDAEAEIPQAHRPLARLVQWLALVAAHLHDGPEEETATWLEHLPVPRPDVSEDVARSVVERYRERDASLRQLAHALAFPES